MGDASINNYNLMNKLSVGQIITYSFNLYKNNLQHFIKISLIFCVPILVLNFILFFINQIQLAPFLQEYQSFASNLDSGDINTLFSLYAKILPIYGIMLISGFLQAILYNLFDVSIIKSTYNITNNKQIDLKEILIQSVKLIVPVIVMGLIISLMISVGFILGLAFCILPGIAFIIFFPPFLVFYLQAIVIEDKLFFSSISRSFSIARNSYAFCLFFPILFGLIILFISVILILLFGMTSIVKPIVDTISNHGQYIPDINTMRSPLQITLNILYQISTIAVFLFTHPFLVISMTIKFLNARNVYEGNHIIKNIEEEVNTIEQV